MGGMVLVNPVQNDSAVEVVIDQLSFLKRFLENRPKVVDVAVRMPDMSDQHYSIPVKYVDG